MLVTELVVDVVRLKSGPVKTDSTVYLCSQTDGAIQKALAIPALEVTNVHPVKNDGEIDDDCDSDTDCDDTDCSGDSACEV